MRKKMQMAGEATTNVVLAAVGDLALHGLYDRHAEEGRVDSVLGEASRAFEGADVVFGNAECVLSDGGEPRSDKLCLRGSPVYAEALRTAGFDVVSTANNHSFDFGPEGFERMAQALRLAGIDPVGAGKNLAGALQPVKLTRNGLRFVFLAYSDAGTGGLNEAGAETPGTAPYLIDEAVDDIERWKIEADELVVSVHWGEEHCPYPSPEQVTEARRMIDAGATLVLGHHSHMFQGIERYKNGLIAYSLGNFLASDIRWDGPARSYAYDLREIDREGIVLRCVLSREGVRTFDCLPIRVQEDGRVFLCEGKRAEEIRAKLAERSAPLALEDYEGFWRKFRMERSVYDPLRKWWRNGGVADKVRRLRLADVRRAGAMAREVLGRRTRPERV
jgi:poly-gamma-glutamate synthesis protein (capsule biosynthesis protein)